MSLPQAVASYLSAWEGHSSLEADAYARVMNLLTRASVSEIVSEMNALTQQQFWNEPLIDLFHDELLRRINSEATFAITTLQRDSQPPNVVIWLGFEDSYLLTDQQGELIRQDDPTITSYTLTNASLQEPVAERLVHLLMEGQVDLTLNLDPIGISDIYNAKSGQRIEFQPSTSSALIREAQIRETPDFNLVKRMYLGLKSGRPVMVDVAANRLIEQLIDYQEAQDIVDDNGDTFEGQLYLTGTGA